MAVFCLWAVGLEGMLRWAADEMGCDNAKNNPPLST